MQLSPSFYEDPNSIDPGLAKACDLKQTKEKAVSIRQAVKSTISDASKAPAASGPATTKEKKASGSKSEQLPTGPGNSTNKNTSNGHDNDGDDNSKQTASAAVSTSVPTPSCL